METNSEQTTTTKTTDQTTAVTTAPETQPLWSSEFLAAVPKTDLHVHFDGSLRLKTLVEVAKADGIPIPYDTEEEAIEIANDTPYGLSSYVFGGTVERATEVARHIRAGNTHINGAGPDFAAPFGGYKMSGIGREWGEHGFEEFLEVKAVLGAGA